LTTRKGDKKATRSRQRKGKSQLPKPVSRKTRAPRSRRASRISSSAAEDDVLVARGLKQSLRASEERYALVAEAVAEGIYDWNIKTNALYVSPRLMEIFSFAGTGTRLTRGTAVCIRMTGKAIARRCAIALSSIR
jgi:PAS domain-containing protein